MSAIVDFEYYSTVYMGTEADEASFPALCARAGDIVGAMTRWAVTEDNINTYPAMVQELYKKAICSQISSLAFNGTQSLYAGMDRGWSVGKVSVSGRSVVDTVRKGVLSEAICPEAIAYLEQTGLLNPAVPVAPDMPMIGWWF